MDSFFASVEQRDFPEYKGKPVAVGRLGPRSVVAAASYEARKFGVYSAMPMSVAMRKCPHLIVAYPRFEAYKEVSAQIREIFHEYTDLVEPLSLDEAYLDVTEAKKGPASASLIAMEIKEAIKQKTNLIASAGVSYNKFLAKTASDVDKPDGFFLIKPDAAIPFLEQMDVGLFFGVGKKTEEKMHKLGIYKGADIKELTKNELMMHFGKAGNYLYNVVRGIDERPVVPHRESKSIGAERTFEVDINDLSVINEKLSEISDIMWSRCIAKNKIGKTLTLKVRFSDFTTITRSHTNQNIYTKDEVINTIQKLLPKDKIIESGVRLLGVTLSNFPFTNAEISRGENEIASLQLEFDFNWDELWGSKERML